MKGLRRSARWVVAWVLAGCLYDSNHRCGARQVYDDEMCLCEEGTSLVGHACVPTPAATPNVDDGGDGEASAEVDGQSATHGYSGQKQACATQEQCASFDASLCDVIHGYCIVPNCSEGDCDEGWTCTDLSQWLAGLPMACTYDADMPS